MADNRQAIFVARPAFPPSRNCDHGSAAIVQASEGMQAHSQAVASVRGYTMWDCPRCNAQWWASPDGKDIRPIGVTQ